MNKILIITPLIILVLAGYFAFVKKSEAPINSPTGVEYKNDEYGFKVSLPDSWKGFSIVKSEWEGFLFNNPQSSKKGLMISIRHPSWTSQNPRQDIPIMVFTIEEWKDLTEDKFHIGAAPINPTELGRNSKYIFALPARYNYAFPTGFEEVEKILEAKPLKTF